MSLRYKHNKLKITNRLLDILKVFLESRYERVGDIADLKKAIRVVRQAVALTPKDHPNLAIYLSNLSNKLKRQYEQTRDMANLVKAI